MHDDGDPHFVVQKMSDHKKSPLGEALFNMMRDMNRAQARVYRSVDKMTETERMAAANRAARIAAARHKPLVLKAIVRPIEGKKP